MQIELDSGRRIKLANLEQWRTYGGVLAGLPEKFINDRFVERALAQARAAPLANGRAVLIPPRERPLSELYPGKRYEACYVRLPEVTSIGMFESGALARPGARTHSSLAIVWYQDEFCQPLAADVLRAIATIDWEREAADWSP